MAIIKISYIKTVWQALRSGGTAWTPDRLNNIENGIETVTNKANEIIDNVDAIDGSVTAWDNSTSYAVNSYAVYNGKLWKAKIANSGQTPAENTYWTAINLKSLSDAESVLNQNLTNLFVKITTPELSVVSGESYIDITSYLSQYSPQFIVAMPMNFGHIVRCNVGKHASSWFLALTNSNSSTRAVSFDLFIY